MEGVHGKDPHLSPINPNEIINDLKHKIEKFDLDYQDHMRRLTNLRKHIDALKVRLALIE